MASCLYIILSGIEYCGKTTQIIGIGEFFKEKGLPFVLTREPGGTFIGKQIRAVILDERSKNMDPLTETLLYPADRAQQFGEIVTPNLEKGISVISDRGLIETEAYQGYGRGMDLDLIRQLNKLATRGISPNLNLVIDGDPELILRNAALRKGKSDRLDQENLEFYQRVRKGFLELAQYYPFIKIVPYIHDGQEEMQGIMRDIISKELGI